METVKSKQNSAYKTLKEEFGYTNVMQAPRIEKVIISTGVGKTRADKRKMQIVEEQLTLIAGQKVFERPAKKSIASFKVREGQLAGFQATLRGQRMFGFLDKLINIALPRTRDFRGINSTVDAMGNYTLGIKENTIFPETADQDIKDVFGFAITIVTSSKNPKETQAFLKHIGLPFKKA
jgi:large subunit ribosomal protein L5